MNEKVGRERREYIPDHLVIAYEPECASIAVQKELNTSKLQADDEDAKLEEFDAVSFKTSHRNKKEKYIRMDNLTFLRKP